MLFCTLYLTAMGVDYVADIDADAPSFDVLGDGAIERQYLAIVVRAGLVVHGLVGVDLRNDSDQRVPLRLGICRRQLLLRHDQLSYGRPLLCAAP